MNGGLEQDLLSLPVYASNSEVEDLQTRIDDKISAALEYACRSWHHHLTETGGETSDPIPHLRIFLEAKFLAWLEVLRSSGTWERLCRTRKLMFWLPEVCFNVPRCIVWR